MMPIMHTSLLACMLAEEALAVVPSAHTPGHNVAVVAGTRGSAAWDASECPNQAVVVAFS